MQVGWVDFSARDRNRTLAVLGSLSTPGAVDELGIGIVRDAIADTLFPSTSTLLTKARYFFLVPYLSRLMEEGHDTSARILVRWPATSEAWSEHAPRDSCVAVTQPRESSAGLRLRAADG